MFIKFTVVSVNFQTDDPKEAVKKLGYITLNSDCIEQYGQSGFTKDGEVVAGYTHIVLKDGDSIDVAQRKVDID